MSEYVVGQFYPEFARRSDGVYLSIDDAGILVNVLFNSPTAKERKAFQSREPLSVCVLRKYDLLVMLLRFSTLPWMDCTFTPNIGKKPVMQDVPDGAGYAMVVRLFDTRNGMLRTQRMISLGTEISREIKHIVDDLSKTPFARDIYNTQIKTLYSTYKTTDLLDEVTIKWSL